MSEVYLCFGRHSYTVFVRFLLSIYHWRDCNRVLPIRRLRELFTRSSLCSEAVVSYAAFGQTLLQCDALEDLVMGVALSRRYHRMAQIALCHCKSPNIPYKLHNHSDDDIICDRPRFGGLLAGSTISSERMIFISYISWEFFIYQILSSVLFSDLCWLAQELSRNQPHFFNHCHKNCIGCFGCPFRNPASAGARYNVLVSWIAWAGSSGKHISPTLHLHISIAMIKNNALKIMSLFASVDYFNQDHWAITLNMHAVLHDYAGYKLLTYSITDLPTSCEPRWEPILLYCSTTLDVERSSEALILCSHICP